MWSRLGAPKAIEATAYQKRIEEEFVVDHQKRMEKNLHRRAKELGYELKKIEMPADELS